MSHRFDSGLSSPVRAALRASVAAALAPLLRANGSYLAALVDLPAPLQFGSDEDEALLDQMLAGNSPAIGVALGKQTFRSGSTDGRSWRGEIMLTVYVCVRHVRSAMAGLVGDQVSRLDLAKDPGAETIIEHALERLAGLATGVPQAAELHPESEEPIYYGSSWQVWELIFRVPTNYELNPNRNSADIASSVLADHHIEAAPPATTITNLEAP